MPKLSTGLTVSAAETIAARALGALSEDPDLFSRFLGETGLSLAGLRAASETSGFLAGVLDFVVRDETTLLTVAAANDVRPETVVAAHARLSRGSGSAGG